ncbi:MAG: alpha/beta hydrolase [Pseudomonadota bacterium]|nr:alpha/beta hydrolase [Pseudomonadota bacterium]
MADLQIPEPRARVDAVMDDGAVIRIRAHGAPRDARIVVSHGNGFAADAYYPFWRSLLDRFEVIVFDLRNYGQSPLHGAENHHFPRIFDDLPLIRDEITINFGDKPSFGAFHSLSGRSNLKYAFDHGVLWDGMVLFDPPMVPPDNHPLHALAMKDGRMLARAGNARREHFTDPSQLVTVLSRSPGLPNWVDGAYDLAARSTLRRDEEAGDWVLCCPAALEASIYLETKKYGVWPARDAFDRPVKWVCADPTLEDAGCPALCGQALHREMGLDYEFVSGTHHFLQMEQPEICARIMTEFVDQHLRKES